MAVEGFEHDVVIIGSGASGGMAGWNLARKGAKVLILDAGAKTTRADFWTHVKPWEARDRRRQGGVPPQWQLPASEQPYLSDPAMPYDLYRTWAVGGRTNVWGRVSLRLSPLNMNEPAVDGWEIPWPMTYDDIAPYYDRVEQRIGVNGGDDDQPWLPGSKFHQPPPQPRCGEMLIKRAAEKRGIKVVNGRRAVLTEPLNGFPACHYCGACGQGCDIAAFFCSADHLLPEAEDSGNLKIVENAVVARILVGDDGLANGVQYFDRYTGEERVVPAKRVIVGAGCLDSTKILLNSRSSYYPNGIGNTSGVIGHYLCDQLRFHVRAFAPELLGGPSHNDDGISGSHIYIPRFVPQGGDKGYLRGYGVQLWGIGCHNSASWAKDLHGFGVDLKKDIKRHYPAFVQFHPYGELIPRYESHVTTEGTGVDKYGIPILKINYKIGDNERRMVDAMYDTVEELAHEMKAEVLPYKRGDIDFWGAAIHEHGTVRMGEDPKRSALNQWCQMHDVKNVFVMDGSAFPTPSEKNPTLTILSLAWRATDYMAEEMKKGNL